MTIAERYIDDAKAKIAMKRRLLAGVRAGWQEPGKGMTKEDTIKVLIQSIADYEDFIDYLRNHSDA